MTERTYEVVYEAPHTQTYVVKAASSEEAQEKAKHELMEDPWTETWFWRAHKVKTILIEESK